jgi:perosamine synthetase
LSARLQKLPGVLPPFVAKDRTSSFHKYRVRFNLEAAGLSEYQPVQVRDALLSALKQTGFEATLWERHPQNHHTIFADATEVPAHVRENYKNKFNSTQALLDSSFLLFTQSCPLIAQNAETVDAYADAFELFWNERKAIVASALGR